MSAERVLPGGAMSAPGTPEPVFTFDGIRHLVRKRSTLWLEPEPNLSPISDDYPADIDPREMFRIWVDRLGRRGAFHDALGEPWVPIYWSLRGSDVCEAAPFQAKPWLKDDFLSYFTWPRDADGDPVNWLALPVRMNGKTRFIEDATGWKPGPLQPAVNLEALEAITALRTPS